MWRRLATSTLLSAGLALLLAACMRPEPAAHCYRSLGIYPAGELNGPPACSIGLKWKLPLNPR